MAFRVVFIKWIDRTEFYEPSYRRLWLVPQFIVSEEERQFIVNLLVPQYPTTFKYEDKEEQFKGALLRFAVRRIEEAFGTQGFLTNASERVQELFIGETELPFIEKLIHEKTCTYQVKEGKDLFCSAGNLTDLQGDYNPTRKSVTSRAVCLACNLPNTDYLCSNLSHPAIVFRPIGEVTPTRVAAGALCDRGQPEIHDPSGCRPGGHKCWERILEPEIDIPEIPSSPLALHEAFGYLDTVWRLAFGRRHALLRLTTMADIAQLSQPCRTRSDFESMMSALAAVLKAMDIPEDLFPQGVSNIQKDHTLERIKDCLKHELGEDYDESCDRAIEVLQAVNAVRYSQQHANQRDLSKAFSRLAIPFPLSSGNEAWGRICAKTIEALGVIREKVRMLSLSSEVS